MNARPNDPRRTVQHGVPRPGMQDMTHDQRRSRLVPRSVNRSEHAISPTGLRLVKGFEQASNFDAVSQLFKAHDIRQEKLGMGWREGVGK